MERRRTRFPSVSLNANVVVSIPTTGINSTIRFLTVGFVPKTVNIRTYTKTERAMVITITRGLPVHFHLFLLVIMAFRTEAMMFRNAPVIAPMAKKCTDQRTAEVV